MWTFKRLSILRAIWKQRIFDVSQSGRNLNATHGTFKVDHWALEVYRALLDLGERADFDIKIRTYGFNYMDLVPGSSDELLQGYTERLKLQKNLHQLKLGVSSAEETTARRAQQTFPDFVEEIMVLFDRERAHISMNPEIGDEPDVFYTEPWILALDNATEPDHRFGFVAYRLSYEQTDEEWETFAMKLTLNMDTWSGIPGAESVKDHATLQWIDGRREEIPEGNITAARK